LHDKNVGKKSAVSLRDGGTKLLLKVYEHSISRRSSIDQDRLCLPRQAARAQEAFPTAKLHWFDKCGHFPMWDQPEETIRLILESTGGNGKKPAAST
jgi:hypothetical protein